MGSSSNGINGLTEQLPSPARAAVVDKGVDFANYFCTYAFLYHQKEMLSDRVRMDAYCMSIFKNKHHFKDKTVLDVGTGSGILAIWCAQAGARKVYAVEATKMSEHARQLVKANNLQGIVEVIEGSIEDITLPEKVDVIISEWMGYFLLRESMLDSVICARDRWLKPTGMMYPSHARMWIAPIRSGLGNQRKNDYESSMIEWDNFVDDTHHHYGVNMRVLTDSYRKENEKYYLQTSLWSNLEPDQVVGIPAIVMELDCLTATVDDIRSLNANFSTSISMESAIVAGFAGWFDVHFRGSQSNPAQHEIELSTAPSRNNPTHWGQQVFLSNPSFIVKGGDKITGSFSMTRSVENHRLLNVEFSYHLQKSSGQLLNSTTSRFYID
ncbi:Arginine N-methyltransferase family protein [Zostera marina]|uniref:Protein arginine N-methyltransferase PRMT10 n=1 Tax=Zostera marina TaxID=29655 RepID=A0A0K9PRD6_ZOSMR|nr:Arginine N-methyltransferase family protein [Zostera marina]